MRILLVPVAVAAAMLCLSSSIPAATLSVGNGSTFNAGSGTLAMNCGDINVAGTLNGGTALFENSRHSTIDPGGLINGNAATFEVMGDWTNNGSFNPGTSTVNFLDGCGLSDATVSGDSTFYDLNIVTGSGKTYFFEVGATQTILNFLTVLGAPGNDLIIRSTMPNEVAFTLLFGGHVVEYVDVQDNSAIGNIIGPAPAPEFNSIKGPKSDGWFIPGVPIPTLSVWGMLLFVLLIMGVTWLRHRPARTRTT